MDSRKGYDSGSCSTEEENQSQEYSSIKYTSEEPSSRAVRKVYLISYSQVELIEVSNKDVVCGYGFVLIS